jgi:biotin carboxylase
MLAGFGGIPKDTVSATGPSSALWIGPHPAMAKVAERMIASLGSSGFIGFDFMLEHGSDVAYLLECNPRPIQVCHLGALIGADLMRPLADALAGRAVATKAAAPDQALEVALFPYAAQRTDVSPGVLLDVPWDDAGLCRYACVNPAERGLPAA